MQTIPKNSPSLKFPIMQQGVKLQIEIWNQEQNILGYEPGEKVGLILKKPNKLKNLALLSL